MEIKILLLKLRIKADTASIRVNTATIAKRVDMKNKIAVLLNVEFAKITLTPAERRDQKCFETNRTRVDDSINMVIWQKQMSTLRRENVLFGEYNKYLKKNIKNLQRELNSLQKLIK